jgi:hypothetical protein
MLAVIPAKAGIQEIGLLDIILDSTSQATGWNDTEKGSCN